MIKVKSIHWLDEDVREADVVLTDGEYNVVCFSHPCELTLNGVYNELIALIHLIFLNLIKQNIAWKNLTTIKNYPF